jgi:hypothetical protein
MVDVNRECVFWQERLMETQSHLVPKFGRYVPTTTERCIEQEDRKLSMPEAWTKAKKILTRWWHN